MKGLKFSIIKLGECENDEAMNLDGLSFATVDDKTKKAVWLRLSYCAILVHHPEVGYILYDTGNHVENILGNRLPASLKDTAAFYVDRKDFLDMQLDRIGVSLDDISTIILSHGHFDHVGGLGFFAGRRAGQNVYISRDELEAGLLAAHSSPEGYADAYFRGDYEIDGIRFKITDEGEFLPGIDLIKLSGHTVGTLGMILHCEKNTYIFPSDAIYTARNFGPPAIKPGLIADTRGYWKTIKRISDLKEKYNAKIIYPHDLDQLNSLKLAPYFYD